MNRKDIAAHKAYASTLEVYELSGFIRQLQAEKAELKPHMDVEKYDFLINAYLDELVYLSLQQNPSHKANIH